MHSACMEKICGAAAFATFQSSSAYMDLRLIPICATGGTKNSLSCLLHGLQREVCYRVASWSSSCQPEYIHLMQTATVMLDKHCFFHHGL